MTLKVLELLASEGNLIATVRLNGPKGLCLRSFRPQKGYEEKLTNMSLLTSGTDYEVFETHESYVSSLREEVSDRLKVQVKIREKNLPTHIEDLLKKADYQCPIKYTRYVPS